MRILIHHPVKLPVHHYGGTERVVMWLGQTLHKMGHKVSVHAAPGSQMPDGIECITDQSKVMKLAKEWDVLHGFSKPSAELYEAFDHKVLVTIQGNGQPGERFDRNTVFVSRNHAERHGATAFVYNGLDGSELKFSSKAALRPDRYLFLSKTSWRVKNLRGAMQMCRNHRQALWIAGGTGPFWQKMQIPFLKGWKWVGSVNQAQKADFLIQGKAMLFPILWNEPFGIVMTESLISGTPVIGHGFGSVPEVLEFAPQCVLNPFSADYEDRMKDLFLNQIPLPSPETCREWVMTYFEQKIMALRYLELYEQVASGKFLNAEVPVTRIGAEDLRGVN